MSENQDQQRPDLVQVDDLDKFVLLLTDWHQNKINTVKHMLEIPVGTPFDFNEEKDLILQGDLHKGFLIGLTVALSELGELPFVAEMETEEPAPTTTDEPAATPAP